MTGDPRTCPHESFAAQVDVNRFADSGRFNAEISVRCSQCGEPFRFLGVGAGLSWSQPSCSIDGLQLQAPIEPQGTPILHTRATYEMPPEEPRH